uniref:Uncharacterized protein n=1 Tax=Cacopsylla melanoneura TaxID=428564 RepID=A0A8D8XAU4_9HEMI
MFLIFFRLICLLQEERLSRDAQEIQEQYYKDEAEKLQKKDSFVNNKMLNVTMLHEQQKIKKKENNVNSKIELIMLLLTLLTGKQHAMMHSTMFPGRLMKTIEN